MRTIPAGLGGYVSADTALPLPILLYNSKLKNLPQFVSSFSVEALSILHIPVYNV